MGSSKILNLHKPYSILDSASSYAENKTLKDYTVGISKVKNFKGLTKFVLSVGYFGALVFSLVKLLT